MGMLQGGIAEVLGIQVGTILGEDIEVVVGILELLRSQEAAEVGIDQAWDIGVAEDRPVEGDIQREGSQAEGIQAWVEDNQQEDMRLLHQGASSLA